MKKRDREQRERGDLAQACRRFGWAQVTIFVLLGLLLEGFHVVKLPAYLDVHLRRELWTLAHAHGALLGLVTVVFAGSIVMMAAPVRARAAGAMRLGAVLVPVGFFLGGIGQAEGDPSLAIVLVPLGAICVAYAAGSAWRAG